MRLLLAAGADPVALDAALELARALDARGARTLVLCGAPGAGEPRLARDGPLVRLLRSDPAPAHWQRSRSVHAARLVRELLRTEDIDLLHVRAWRGLTHDLVALAHAVGVPAIVALTGREHACLVGDRVRRDVPGDCAAPLGPTPCLGCAEAHPRHGPTPWVPIEARYLRAAEWRRDAVRELELARAVLVAGASVAGAARRELDDDLARVAFRVLADPSDADALARVHADVLARAERIPPAPEAGWWVERMQVEAEQAWDEGYRSARRNA